MNTFMLRKVSLVVFNTVLYNFITWMNIRGMLRGKGTHVDECGALVIWHEEGSLCGFNLKGDLKML